MSLLQPLKEAPQVKVGENELSIMCMNRLHVTTSFPGIQSNDINLAFFFHCHLFKTRPSNSSSSQPKHKLSALLFRHFYITRFVLSITTTQSVKVSPHHRKIHTLASTDIPQMAETKESKSNSDFTPREMEIMAKAWCCMTEEPKVRQHITSFEHSEGLIYIIARALLMRN